MHTDDAEWSCHLQKLFSLYPLNKYSPTNRIFAGSTVFQLSLGLKEETRRKKTESLAPSPHQHVKSRGS